MFLVDSCRNREDDVVNESGVYKPVDTVLFDAIISMDKQFFDAYNNCDLAKQAEIYADDIEFFHDQGGLTTSKQDLIDATKMNICGKVTRELIEGSVEVYPIKNYGAVQVGLHKFHNKQEPHEEAKPSKFITMWRKENEKWKMAKVISLH